MVILAYSVRIEANLKLQFLFGPQRPLTVLNLKNPLFLDLIILQKPVNILFINITNSHSDELRVASVRFSDYLAFEVYEGWLEDELRGDALAFYDWSAV